MKEMHDGRVAARDDSGLRKERHGRRVESWRCVCLLRGLAATIVVHIQAVDVLPCVFCLVAFFRRWRRVMLRCAYLLWDMLAVVRLAVLCAIRITSHPHHFPSIIVLRAGRALWCCIRKPPLAVCVRCVMISTMPTVLQRRRSHHGPCRCTLRTCYVLVLVHVGCAALPPVLSCLRVASCAIDGRVARCRCVCARPLPHLALTRINVELRLRAQRLLRVCRPPRPEGCRVRGLSCVGMSSLRRRPELHASMGLPWLNVEQSSWLLGCAAAAAVAAGGGDAVDAAVVEAAVLAEIKGSRSGAEHFRVISVMGNGEFGYVFKVRCDVS